MPKGKVFYGGSVYSIELALTEDGECPAQTFLDSLTIEQRAKIVRIIKRLADFGRINNREQFKKIEDDFFEFKYFQIRMPCFFNQVNELLSLMDL